MVFLEKGKAHTTLDVGDNIIETSNQNCFVDRVNEPGVDHRTRSQRSIDTNSPARCDSGRPGNLSVFELYKTSSLDSQVSRDRENLAGREH